MYASWMQISGACKAAYIVYVSFEISECQVLYLGSVTE